MKWIKASEPSENGTYFVKTNMGRQVVAHYDTRAKWCPQDFPMWQDGERPLYHLDETEQAPASIEDEAERLYPYAEENYYDKLDHDYTADIQRSAHITCARQYLSRLAEKDGEIEGLKKEVAYLSEQLKSCADDYNNLQDQANAWKEESGN